MDLRFVSTIILFTTSLTTCFIAFLYGGGDRSYTRLLKMFSAGVILALALVHIISESIVSLASVIDYPLGGVCVLIGLSSLMIVEHISHVSTVCTTISEKPCHTMNEIDHNHTCITSINSADMVAQNKKRSNVMVCIFEFACMFHSIFIGISMGLVTEQVILRNMLIAITFHQMLEGISLGSILSESSISRVKIVIMIITYCLTTPLGVIIGLLLEKSYNTDENNTKIIITGCFQSCSGGLLLYVALFQIIAEEFSKMDLHTTSKTLLKFGMYLSLLLGAASMCALAVIL